MAVLFCSASEMKPYHTFVKAQQKRNPSLSNLCYFLDDRGTTLKTCRVAFLHFVSNGAILRQDIREVDLVRALTESHRRHDFSLGKVIFVEDLSQRIVEALGHQYGIDPSFFAGHIDSPAVHVGSATPASSSLPSLETGKGFVNIRYHRILKLTCDCALPEKLLRSMNLRRKVAILPSLLENRIGIAQHCCSILKLRDGSGQWICIILIDSPIDNRLTSMESLGVTAPLSVRVDLFQGGYEDFRERCGTTPARHGLFDDMLHFWAERPPPEFRANDPSLLSLTYFPLRVIAAEWNIYLRLMYLSIKHFEYRSDSNSTLLSQLDALNGDLRGLQLWRRRGMATQDKLRGVLRFVQNEATNESLASMSEHLTLDFGHLLTQACEYSQLLNSMLPMITSLISIVDTRRSIFETANISRLTYLALIFVPLGYVSSLFSMNDAVAPGSAAFWIYFAVAIPLTLLVFLIACISNKALGKLH